MNATLKSLAGAVGSIAPTLATMLGGPLAGAAVGALASAFGLSPTASADDVTKVVQEGGMTPEIIAAVRSADQAHAEKMKALDIDLAKLNADSQSSLNHDIIADVADARKANAGNETVLMVGMFILGSFLLAMLAVLWGCWSMISGKVVVTPEQAGMFAAVTGLVGAIVGYFASNAQTVVNYLFGGSLGGRKNADALADNVQSMGAALGKVANSPTTIVDSTIK